MKFIQIYNPDNEYTGLFSTDREDFKQVRIDIENTFKEAEVIREHKNANLIEEVIRILDENYGITPVSEEQYFVFI